MPSKNKTNVATTDRELLEAITRDLRAIYSDVIRQPLPTNWPQHSSAWKPKAQQAPSGRGHQDVSVPK